MPQSLKILLLEDSRTDAEIIQRLLLKENPRYRFSLAMSKEEFLQQMNEFGPDIILSDNSLPQFNSSEALVIARTLSDNIPFILVTGTVSEEYAAFIIKEGADDYILKDRMIRLPSAIDFALRRRKAIKELTDYKYGLDQSAIVAITDKEGVIVYANDNFCSTSGFSQEELLGSTHRIVNSEYHPPAFFEELWNTIKSGKIWKGEICNKTKNGRLYWVNTTIIPFMDSSGTPYQYLSIRIDITGRKETEQLLKKSNERFRYATMASTEVIWELNFESKTLQVHEGKHNFFGVEKELEWQTAVKGEYIVPGFLEKVKESFRKAKKDPHCELWEEEYRVVASDNSVIDIVNHAIFIRDATGKALKAVGAVRDVTEKRKLENELNEQRRREQLKITATTLEAQEKERNLIAQELHDNVNQILVGTKLILSTLLLKRLEDRKIIDDCMQNLQKAIDENRHISHKLVTPDMENIDITEQILQLTESMLKPLAIEIKMDSRSFEENTLNKDQKLAVYRIVQEQCTNIVKYAKASRVEFILSTRWDRFIMHIKDNGQGAETADMNRGIGLKNIRARLSVLNGSAAFHTAKGDGFLLTVEIQLGDQE